MIKENMEEFKSGFARHIGGLSIKKIDDSNYQFKADVKEINLNTGMVAHGGYLCSLADTGMGNAAHKVAGDKRCVTISLEVKFISPAQLNDNLVGNVSVKKKTNTLVFISCEILNKKSIVATASGVWKILK